jgi:hypothetical protein
MRMRTLRQAAYWIGGVRMTTGMPHQSGTHPRGRCDEAYRVAIGRA